MKSLVIGDRATECRMVIFDKDGTLFYFADTFVPLIRRRAEIVSSSLDAGNGLLDVLMRAWGVDPVTGAVDPAGPCPVALQSEELIIGASAVYREGFPWLEARRAVKSSFDQADIDLDRSGLARPVPGAKGVLNRLKQAGLLLGLATGDDRNPTEAMLARSGLRDLFDEILCAEDVRASKPDPGILFDICRRTGVPPSEAIYVGDTPSDMIAGRDAGMKLVVGVLEGGIVPREAMEETADILIDTLEEIKIESD